MNKATQNLIGSIWTLSYNILENGKIEILSFNRNDQEGYEKERELPRLNLIEDDQRTVLQVALMPFKSFCSWANMDDPTTIVYDVENPKHVFSYGA